jgi:hypothetical protein
MAPDPGSGSATLALLFRFILTSSIIILILRGPTHCPFTSRPSGYHCFNRFSDRFPVFRVLSYDVVYRQILLHVLALDN